MMKPSALSVSAVRPSPQVGCQRSVTSRRPTRALALGVRAEARRFPGMGAAQYVSEAFAQIFSPSTGKDVAWRTSPFDGNIRHHGAQLHRPFGGGAKMAVAVAADGSHHRVEIGHGAAGQLIHGIESVMGSNFKTSGEHEPKSFGGGHGYSGSIARNQRMIQRMLNQ